jgi:hypothetical protein
MVWTPRRRFSLCAICLFGRNKYDESFHPPVKGIDSLWPYESFDAANFA